MKRIATVPTSFGEIRVSLEEATPGSPTSVPVVLLHETYRPTVGEVPDGRGSVTVLQPRELRLLLRALLQTAPMVGVYTRDPEEDIQPSSKCHDELDELEEQS